MGSQAIIKVETVYGKVNALKSDLFLDKRDGSFFARVGGELVREKTKDEALTKIRGLLNRVTGVQWRQVIVLRIDKRRWRNKDSGDIFDNAQENGRIVYSSSCSFTYFRRERAQNPLKKSEIIEREHADEFELRIERVRENAERGVGLGYAKERKERADRDEAAARAARDSLERVDMAYECREYEEEHEMPYTPEAWAGIQRIAATLREMQAKLDEFTRGATPTSLAQLAKEQDVFKRLPAAAAPRAKP